MASKLKTPKFFVFSDEPDWVRKNMKLPAGSVLVSHHGADSPQEDLRLMSACRHQVIANSSLSWWGAWLNPRKDKQVVAPARWFSAGSGADYRDVVPESWTRVEG
jgi:hypothetical protein